jgi:hypothetical protein
MRVRQLARILSYLPPDAEVVLAASGDASDDVSGDQYQSVTAVSLLNLCPAQAVDELSRFFVKASASTTDIVAQVPAAVIVVGDVGLHVRDR